MKKVLLTFVLLAGIASGLFAQKLTYQAVVRDNNQQLVVNTDVKATVTIAFTSGDPYRAEVNGSTNLHGLLSFEFGDATLLGRDWTNATIAVKVAKADDESTVYVSDDEPRPVSAVPYALGVDGMAIQQYLTEHHYVTDTQVGVQIRDSIANIAQTHTHSNKDLLDTYAQTEDDLASAVAQKHSHDNMSVLAATKAPYTDDDSTKLKGIEEGAEVNVQSDWNETSADSDAYIKNKPSIRDTVNGILTTGGYVTETTMNGRHYLTSDSTVIKTMQGSISKNANVIDSLILHTAKAAIRDSVAGQIRDSISNIAAKAHEHGNKDLLDDYTQTEDDLKDAVAQKHSHDNMSVLAATKAPYTDADSAKLRGIADSAEVNVQSDWKQTDNAKDDFIKNKPSIRDTVTGILTAGRYVTADSLDDRHYLTKDSTVITAMQDSISTNKAGIQTNAGAIGALAAKERSDSSLLAGRIDALAGAAMDCDDVKACIKDTLGSYTTTDRLCGVINGCDLSANASLNTLLNAINSKMDSLARVVDSLAKLIPIPFTCGTSKVKDVDNNEYNTVQIGNQCWMAENLRTDVGDGVYPKKNNGTEELDAAEQVTYGRLYDWTIMMNGASSSEATPSGVQGICPTGWHVPSDAEWTTLTSYVKSQSEYVCGDCSEETDDEWSTYCIANALSGGTWEEPEDCAAGHSGSATFNKTGFAAVPAGYCFDGDFGAFGRIANFWSATQYDGNGAWYRSLYSYGSYVDRYGGLKGNGFSVRCLRD